MRILPSLSFDAPTLPGGLRRYAGTLLLPIPALVYGLTLGTPGLLDEAASMLRNAAGSIAMQAGASRPGTILLYMAAGTFLLPLAVLAIAWIRANLFVMQAAAAWISQLFVNLGLYVIGAMPDASGRGLLPHLRVQALSDLGLLGHSTLVSSGLVAVGIGIFVAALLLPLAASDAHPDRARGARAKA